MAEILQCPICLQWLNLELHEARIVDTKKLTYECQKCGAEFTEDGKIIRVK